MRVQRAWLMVSRPPNKPLALGGDLLQLVAGPEPQPAAHLVLALGPAVASLHVFHGLKPSHGLWPSSLSSQISPSLTFIDAELGALANFLCRLGRKLPDPSSAPLANSSALCWS